MSHVCQVCLGPIRGDSRYHPRCLRDLFHTTKIPSLDLDIARLHTAGLAMVGHTSLSGIQKKISVNLAADRATLQIATSGGRYILKPQTGTYPALPENEHLTTRLARLVSIEVAPSGLLSLTDGSLAFIALRFDRLDDGRKVPQEDFCQLAEQPIRAKYDGSMEQCIRLLRKYASEPAVEILRLYRLTVFIWWSGNGDMHLKNFSLNIDPTGLVCLSPAYDLVSSCLVIPDDRLALPVGGKDDHLTRGTWLEFARYCQLPEKVALGVLEKQARSLTKAQELISRSFLPEDQKQAYTRLVDERTATL
jgi:serine/threonine-protein kinase HipA